MTGHTSQYEGHWAKIQQIGTDRSSRFSFGNKQKSIKAILCEFNVVINSFTSSLKINYTSEVYIYTTLFLLDQNHNLSPLAVFVLQRFMDLTAYSVLFSILGTK